MGEIKLPIVIDGYKCVEDMAQAVLNYTYKGKTLKEWADSISKPQTNADRIRAMTDEELANLINRIEPRLCHDGWDYMIGCDEDKDCVMCWLDWLRQECER